MTDFDPDANESIAARTERALTECMTVLPEGGDIYTVVGENGGTYRVDSRETRCTCPDHKHRNARCKHQRRVALATAARTIPGAVDRDAVDPQLGAHTDATPRVAATDGGSDTVLEGGDEPATDARPDDCSCLPSFDALPCWPCYREGFDVPNPDPDTKGDGQDRDGRDEPTRSEPADFGGGESTGVQDL